MKSTCICKDFNLHKRLPTKGPGSDNQPSRSSGKQRETLFILSMEGVCVY